MKTQLLFLIISFIIRMHTSAGDPPPDSLTTYFAFAYYYNNDGTLLITRIQPVEMKAETRVTKESPLNQFTRENNDHYRRYLIRNYPGIIQFIPLNIGMLKIDPDLEALRKQRSIMIKKNGRNVIEVMSFQVQLPE